MRSYGPRFDVAPDGLAEQTMRVSQAHDYELAIIHYRRRVGSGTITCQTMKAAGAPGRRIVQLEAEYEEGGVLTTRIVGCHSQREELEQLQRLEEIIRAAERKPTATPGAWHRQAAGRSGAR